MRHIQTYGLFESTSELTSEQRDWLNECTEGEWIVNPSTGEVDVKGSFYCSGQGLKDFKGVRFGRVSGNFSCSDNVLTSLVGAPQEVEGKFSCDRNRLTNLVGAPQKMQESFECQEQVPGLTSLEGSPQRVWNFRCDGNRLTDLVGAPQKVSGYFWCNDNELTSLKGGPQEVGGNFMGKKNRLTSVEGAPQKISGYFDFSLNPVSEKALKLIIREMRDSEVSYPIALAHRKDEISERDWELLDKGGMTNVDAAVKGSDLIKRFGGFEQ